MFTDEVIIKIKAGKGGDGLVSFWREKFVPKGGPDGGDGGDGGDIIFKVDERVNTLSFFNTRKQFKAEDGEKGKKARCRGKNGRDLILRVPPGTIVYQILNSKIETLNKSKIQDSKFKKVADLTKDGQKMVIARGGRGGWGNVHFATATHQTPKEAKPGQPGEEKILKLELQLIADVGIIGLPNSGKSTLLSRISAARPKIAEYPFTTLEPNLGVVRLGEDFSFVVADIPGLIKGASKGKGLGDKFLRHIKRTRLLVHLIDITSSDLVRDYKTIRSELKLFDPTLISKKEIIVLNKIDLLGEKKPFIPFVLKKLKPLMISAVSGKGIKTLLYEIKRILKPNSK